MAATLIAAAGAASPAAAAPTADLHVTAPDVTMAADSAGKPVHLTLTNHGPADVPVATLVVDTRDLDTSKVRVEPVLCDEPQSGVYECHSASLEMDVVPSGIALDWPFMITRLRGASGDAGSITFTARHDGTDPEPGNNLARVGVTIGGHGPDLIVSAGDVRHAGRVLPNGDTDVTGPLHPGENGLFGYLVRNVGDRPAAGIKLTAKLPAHVTFTRVGKGCALAPGRGSMTCTYPDRVLVPAGEDQGDDSVLSAVDLVRVAAGTTAPVTLTGGLITVEALAAGPAEAEAPGRTDAAPTGAVETEPSGPAEPTRAADAEPPGPADVEPSPPAVAGSSPATRSGEPQDAQAGVATELDPGDNRDGFQVAVVAAPSGGGSGGGGSGGGTGGGTLPITGVQVGLIGGIGAAVVLAGVLLLLAGRRRRVVTAVPTAEKPGS
ncbi:hypothetical protein ONA91_10890 [Micromonospora sp. DR5-3]|uniref:hypothetical protein n=1 Tax=unclassified Micromonospora TaxID=2617518 RepID=UPI0011D46D32|nr:MULTISPECIES: hypothetical protein [unclassified Micromonospora]MCW3814961.1 hypothetical protein [Micromonospora sp. DR5-3]TYC25288.1 hypothetical protein FXF52_05645 [Micromonospora sp. MP36]